MTPKSKIEVENRRVPYPPKLPASVSHEACFIAACVIMTHCGFVHITSSCIYVTDGVPNRQPTLGAAAAALFGNKLLLTQAGVQKSSASEPDLDMFSSLFAATSVDVTTVRCINRHGPPPL